MNNQMMYKSRTLRVNQQTGELITEQQANKLIHVKTIRNAATNKNRTITTVTRTKLYTRNPQLELPNM